MKFRSVKLFNFHIDYIFWMSLYEIYNAEFKVLAYTSKKLGITPILTLIDSTTPQLLTPPSN